MTKKARFNFQILSIPFLIVNTTIIAVFYYLLQFLDLIVHGDLYNYGLIFSYEWANQYWNYSSLIRNSILISIPIIIVAIIFVIIQVTSARNFIKSISSSLIVTRIFFMVLSFFSLIQIDRIVNSSLYDYGLNFSFEWAGPYWNILILFNGLFVLIILIDIISISLLLAHEAWFYSRIKSFSSIRSLLFFVGIAAIFLSINFNSSVLTFVGLGCMFWGAILMYVRSGKYVKEELLLTATRSALVSLRQLILELGYEGEGIYLPPKYLKDFESSKVFISKDSGNALPLVVQIQDKNSIFIKSPKGLLVTPPGFSLSKLFEETLETNFTQKNLSFVESNLHRLIVEELEIAEEAQTIMDAQKARGLELERGNFIKKVKNYIPILIPLIVSAIRRSLELAEAMESRAWGATKKRTNLYVLKMKRGDYILILVSTAILVFATYVWVFHRGQIPMLSYFLVPLN